MLTSLPAVVKGINKDIGSTHLDTTIANQVNELRAHIARLEQETSTLQVENKRLLEIVDELLVGQFCITKFKDSDSDVNFYYAFPNYQTLLGCYDFLNPGENGQNIVYATSLNDDLEWTVEVNEEFQ